MSPFADLSATSSWLPPCLMNRVSCMEHRSQWGLQRCWGRTGSNQRHFPRCSANPLWKRRGETVQTALGEVAEGARTAGRRWSPSPSVPEFCDASFLSAVFFRQLPKLQRGWSWRVGYGRWGRWLLPPEGSSGQWEGSSHSQSWAFRPPPLFRSVESHTREDDRLGSSPANKGAWASTTLPVKQT